MIRLDKGYFQMYTGYDLDLQLDGKDDDINKSERQLQRWTRTVYREINSRSLRPIPLQKHLSEIQKKTLKDAVCEYGNYVLENGDLFLESGLYRRDTHLNQKDLKNARFPEHIVRMVDNVGLIRKTFGTRIIAMPTYQEWTI